MYHIAVHLTYGCGKLIDVLLKSLQSSIVISNDDSANAEKCINLHRCSMAGLYIRSP